MPRNRWVMTAGALLAVLVAAVIVVLSLGGSHTPASTASGPAGTLPPAQQSRLEHGLSDPSVAGQSAVVAAEIRTNLMNRAQPVLPAGSAVRLDLATFTVTEPDAAVVDATVSGPEPGRWQLSLVQEGGQWLVIGTRRLG